MDSLLTSCRFPIFDLWEQATRSRAAATVFLAAFLTVALVAVNAIFQTASRLTWAFSRDNALFFSQKLSFVDARFHTPILAIALNGVAVALIGILYPLSTTGESALLVKPQFGW